MYSPFKVSPRPSNRRSPWFPVLWMVSGVSPYSRTFPAATLLGLTRCAGRTMSVYYYQKPSHEANLPITWLPKQTPLLYVSWLAMRCVVHNLQNGNSKLKHLRIHGRRIRGIHARGSTAQNDSNRLPSEFLDLLSAGQHLGVHAERPQSPQNELWCCQCLIVRVETGMKGSNEHDWFEIPCPEQGQSVAKSAVSTRS